jgi:protein-S-isoprenylcysteine O-methyltransferase Ste14
MLPYQRIIMCSWSLWTLYWFGAALWNRQAVLRKESQASWLSWRLLTVAAWIFLLLPMDVAVLRLRLVPSTDLWACLGLGLHLAGLLYSVWARLTLGSNWSSKVTIKEGHQLIRSGPYAYTRHPIYTGIIMGGVGTAVVMGDLQAWLGVGFLIGAFQQKLSVEERFMRDQFGSSYDSYAAKVKRLIPFLY